MDKMRAWEVLNRLSYVRVAGTQAEKDAAAALAAECEKAGVKAEIETFEIDDYEVEKAEFEVLEPEYCRYDVIAMGRSGSTPDEGIEAGFKYIENANDTNLIDIKGKIVLVQGRVTKDLMKKLIEKGAVGYILIGGKIYEEESIKQELRPGMTREKESLPGIKMHIELAEKLIRSNPSKVRMTLKQVSDKVGESQNVVATIEGSDEQLKKEVLIFSGHYDSVPYSKGSWDNLTGSVTVLELLHYFAENRPRRTVKFLFCGSEEIGCVGSRKYCEKHQEELDNYIYNINFDMTGVTVGYEHFCCTASQDVLNSLVYLANVKGYPVNTALNTYSSDSSSFAAAGVPACTFARLAPNGGAEIHNHHDTMDRLDPDSFMITLNFVALYGDQIANADVNPIPRKFDEKITKALDEMKKFFS